jgi:hypothetical protein
MRPALELVGRLGVTWTTVAWGLALFVLTAGGSLALATALLVRLPATYFVGDAPPVAQGGLAARLAKNLLGLVLVVAGAIMAIPGVPGQGLLTILLGVMLLDFPGKRRLERGLVGRPGVRRAVDGLRARFGRPPLVIDPPEDGPKSGHAAKSSDAPRGSA